MDGMKNGFHAQIASDISFSTWYIEHTLHACMHGLPWKISNIPKIKSKTYEIRHLPTQKAQLIVTDYNARHVVFGLLIVCCMCWMLWLPHFHSDLWYYFWNAACTHAIINTRHVREVSMAFAYDLLYWQHKTRVKLPLEINIMALHMPHKKVKRARRQRAFSLQDQSRTQSLTVEISTRSYPMQICIDVVPDSVFMQCALIWRSPQNPLHRT